MCLCTYVCLCISEKITKDGRKELGIFCYYKVLNYPLGSIGLFESGLGFVVNVGQPLKKVLKEA